MGAVSPRRRVGWFRQAAGWLLEWRARRIADPIARLRFLRRTVPRPAGSNGPHRIRLALAVALALMIVPAPSVTNATGTIPLLTGAAQPARFEQFPEIWQVEKNQDYEVYSNGLRIETRGQQKHEPREFVPLPRNKPEEWSSPAVWNGPPRTQPVGIVYHTTESDLVPFEASQNPALKRLGLNLLSYVRRNRCYHYLVDRFGRVHRVVEESSAADHAGWSIWADHQWVYVNLNHSFLAIAFEAQTRPQKAGEAISEAQVHAARVLTDMLRSKYRIPGANCITHAQVSVNPDNFRIGAHTDWATGFPFAAMGLPNNYSQPAPSLVLFGFTYDHMFVELSEQRIWKGLLLAEEGVRQAAIAQGLKVSEYRSALRRRYKEMIELQKQQRKESL